MAKHLRIGPKKHIKTPEWILKGGTNPKYETIAGKLKKVVVKSNDQKRLGKRKTVRRKQSAQWDNDDLAILSALRNGRLATFGYFE